MPNSFFHFKAFTIHQDKCAMKVCTDACILGAWTATQVESDDIKDILDIGCGTGLLSLMLAQKIDASIDAIDINRDAAMQARENVSGSPWKDRVNVHNISLQEFKAGKTYDLIVCNPPFYEDDLRSGNAGKDAAKHDTGLTFEALVPLISGYLNNSGLAAVLLPFHRADYFESKAKAHALFVKNKLLLKQSPKRNFFRVLLLLSKEKGVNETASELTIHDGDRNYTAEFELLLKDYYLKL